MILNVKSSWFNYKSNFYLLRKENVIPAFVTKKLFNVNAALEFSLRIEKSKNTFITNLKGKHFWISALCEKNCQTDANSKPKKKWRKSKWKSNIFSWPNLLNKF